MASDLSCLWEMIMASWGPGGVPFLHSSSRLRDKLGFYSITKRREKPLRLVTLKEPCHEIEVNYLIKKWMKWYSVNEVSCYCMVPTELFKHFPYGLNIYNCAIG